MKKIWNKLRSTAGESLAETLLAVLVIAVAAIVLATMISSTASMIKRSEAKMDEYYKQNEILETFPDGGVTSGTISISVSDTSDTYSISSIPINYVQNDKLSRYTVTAYSFNESGTGG